MSRQTCPHCGGRKSSYAAVCLSCKAQERKPAATCERCGTVLARGSARLCWDCHLKERVEQASRCTKCGLRISSHNRTKLCGPCFRELQRASATVPRCVECGKERDTQNPTRKAKSGLCYTCYRLSMRKNPPVCIIQDCTDVPIARGLCRRHYYQIASVRERRYGSPPAAMRSTIGKQPCALCGYDKMQSELHRRIPENGYTAENIVPLCARCHDELEHGLVALPTL